MALDASFYKVADAVIEWLDKGNYDPFADALEALEQEYFEEPEQVDPKAPKDKRVKAWAAQYAAATKALSDFRLVGQLIEQRRDMARAELIAAAAEPTIVPEYWARLIKRIQIKGITQDEVHPSSRALAEHLAKAIRDFNAGGGGIVDESYEDLPIDSWADLPRNFAGFRLVDVAPNDPVFEEQPPVHPLPPSTDIAYFTVDGSRPSLLDTRDATYRAWIKIVRAWLERTNQELDVHVPSIWAMLLAYRAAEDDTNVVFFDRQLIMSPWNRDRVVMISIEDDIPPHIR